MGRHTRFHHSQIGDPYISLALAIVGYSHAGRLYDDLIEYFQAERISLPSPDSAASYVGAWLAENHTVKGNCPSCGKKLEVLPSCEMTKVKKYKLVTFCPFCEAKILVKRR